MVKITEELVRKKCEHNEGEIYSLEELALHQENIEKIEHIQNWCRDLKILLFHSNLISKIENLNKLKKLEYLNLSLNNIEIIENLEGCESLKKLDLTLNFVGELTSVENLTHNIHLKDLYLTGNPCTDYQGYQEFVIATLSQLTTLDGHDIQRSERIKAVQKLEQLRKKIIIEQEKYKVKRLHQKAENEMKYKEKKGVKDIEGEDSEESLKESWNEPCDHSPETRVYLAEKYKRLEKRHETDVEKIAKRVYRLFGNEGEPLNVNEARISFCFHESNDGDSYILDIPVYKHLDTSLLEVDVQPKYVRVAIKAKNLQIVLPEEIETDNSIALRSQTTGHLVITMPKVKSTPTLKKKPTNKSSEKFVPVMYPHISKRELLEIGPPDSQMDFSTIVRRNELLKMSFQSSTAPEKKPSSDFVEDPNVPALE